MRGMAYLMLPSVLQLELFKQLAHGVFVCDWNLGFLEFGLGTRFRFITLSLSNELLFRRPRVFWCFTFVGSHAILVGMRTDLNDMRVKDAQQGA